MSFSYASLLGSRDGHTNILSPMAHPCVAILSTAVSRGAGEVARGEGGYPGREAQLAAQAAALSMIRLIIPGMIGQAKWQSDKPTNNKGGRPCRHKTKGTFYPNRAT